jgi:hypothetical protein
MSVLSDRTIQELVEREELGIEPFDASNLTPNGYDLSISEVLLPTARPFPAGPAWPGFRPASASSSRPRRP